MINFVSSPKIMETLRNIAGKVERADLAVAFWGAGAFNSLKFSANASLRIICDLQSGACNPHELIKILKRGNVQIRSRRKFHAKVYLFPTCVMVTSANASANGLGDEGDETAGTIEAAALTDDKAAVEAATQWFEEQWDDAYDDVDKKRARMAIPLWEARQKAKRALQGRQRRLTIGRQFAANRRWFNERRIWIICLGAGDPSQTATKGFEAVKEQFFDKRELGPVLNYTIPKHLIA
jgi:hypothetical protein